MRMTIERTKTVDAARDAAWAVVSNLDGYADHAAGLAETTVIEGSEVGAVRRCIDTSGADWLETCIRWEPGEQIVVEVDVASYPLKFRSLFAAFRGTWWIREVPNATVIGIRFEADLKPLARPLRDQIERRVRKDLDEILQSYGRALSPMRAVRSADVEAPGPTGDRLSVHPCTTVGSAAIHQRHPERRAVVPERRLGRADL